jgi:2-keto-myo-inositol isomerase
MFLGLNEATLLPLDALTFAGVAGAAGFDGVEFRIERVEECLRRGKLGDLAGVLKSHQLGAVSLNALEDFSLAPAQRFGRMLEKVEFLFSKVCGEIGCDLLVAVPSFLRPGKAQASVAERTRKRLEELSRVAGEYGGRIGFEFLGFRECSVNTLEKAWRIVGGLDLENLGLVIDTFHFHLSGSSLETLARIPGQRIFLVHVNDAPPLPKDGLRDAHRILPGKGIIPLGSFLRALRETKYDGYLSIELFNEEYWKQNPGHVAAEALSSLKSVLESSGIFPKRR